MAYENDIIMRQVRDMTRMLAKILFGKNTATYEYKEEDRHTATDSLYARLIALVDAGKINEAENRLQDLTSDTDVNNLEVALLFYSCLNDKTDDFLEKNDFSRDEIKLGLENVIDKFGLSSIAKAFLEDLQSH